MMIWFTAVFFSFIFSLNASQETIVYPSIEAQQHGHFIYQSQTPIESIANPSRETLELSNLNLSISPGEVYDFASEIYEIEISNADKIDAVQIFSTQDINNLLSQPTAKYQKNPYVETETWEQLEPYFLPDNHPIKATLDRIFSKSRALASNKAMKKAGFKLLKQPKNKLAIAKHPKLKGYLVKAYLDPMLTTDWVWWIKRIEGARAVQNSIDKHGYQALIKVPQKWIYPLPPEPSPKVIPGAERKNFILVVEDMRVLNYEDNLEAYYKKPTRTLLNAIYTIITENLLIDSIYIDNIPFCKDGKLAFIDTEHCNDTSQPLKIERIAQYLSKEMHAYWEQLIQHGAPQ